MLDLPKATVTRDSFYVMASASTFYAQANSPLTANFNWSGSALNASTGDAYLRKYEYNGTNYVKLDVTVAEVNDILRKRSGSEGQYHVLVYDENDLVNFFVGGDNTLPSYVNTWATLAVPAFKNTGWDTVNNRRSFNFSSLTTNNVEAVISNTGSNNGYRRTNDGQCGTWVKSSSGSEHTPGRTNGATSSIGRLTISVGLSQAASNVNALNLAYGISGTTDATVWPITVRVVNDYSLLGDDPSTLTVNEGLLPEGTLTPYNDVDVEEPENPGVTASGVPDTNYRYPLPLFQQAQQAAKSYLTAPIYATGLYQPNYTGAKVIRAFHVFFQCNSGCIDQVYYARMTTTPVLPVEFKTFTAKRNQDQVQLNWQTASEHSNTGFTIERNTTGQWVEIAFVPTQATGGNSDVPLSYQYLDNNPHKGISQYRIRQTDLNDKTSYSAIRSVQGEGSGTKLVIYPNPSFDGRVQVVFQDAIAVRHLVITDMGGRIVRQFNNINTSSVTVDRLTAGLYTARVIDQTTGESILQKFVVQQK